MALRRIFLTVAGAAAFSMCATAQVVAPSYKNSAGQLQEAIGTICLTSAGTECTSGGSGGGGTVTLGPGSAIAGSFRIDQTTPGTTNGVVARGGVAVGSADSGDPNPIKLGAVYRATLTSRADNSRTELITNDYGTLRVGIAGQANEGAGADAKGNTTAALTFNTSNSTGPFQVANFVYNGTSWDRQRGDTIGVYIVPKGTASLASGQISVGTSSTLVAAARTGRSKITLAVGAANTCAFGNTGVTTSTGFPLQPVAGASLVLDTSAAIYAACSATTTVSFLEQF